MKAFTLIELLIVFAITGIIAMTGIFTFSSYNSSQVFGTGISEFSSVLNTARSRAISQVKPSSCVGSVLDGYKVVVTVSGQDYRQYAVCSGVDYIVAIKKLPSQISFTSDSATSIFFSVSTGAVLSPGVIKISGYGKTNTITIGSTGVISSQ